MEHPEASRWIFASSVLPVPVGPTSTTFDFDVDIVITFLIDALVMVVDGHGKIFLGLFLTDDILVKKLLLSPWVSESTRRPSSLCPSSPG